jgi:hypothetical protein
MLNLSQIRNLRLAAAEVFPSPSNREAPGQRDEAADRSLNHTQARILSIGDDSILLYSRRLILETAGYSVECARGNIATIEEALLRRFDLVLLCHSIPEVQESSAPGAGFGRPGRTVGCDRRAA